MKYEKSCGAVCFRKDDGVLKVLVIRHRVGGHWSFPKGHVESGETENQTAIREVREETGVDIDIIKGFAAVNSYSPSRGVMKKVVYFAATAASDAISIQPEEISEALWISANEAPARLTHAKDREILARALKYITRTKDIV